MGELDGSGNETSEVTMANRYSSWQSWRGGLFHKCLLIARSKDWERRKIMNEKGEIRWDVGAGEGENELTG